jgi:hypothetical protein
VRAGGSIYPAVGLFVAKYLLGWILATRHIS